MCEYTTVVSVVVVRKVQHDDDVSAAMHLKALSVVVLMARILLLKKMTVMK